MSIYTDRGSNNQVFSLTKHRDIKDYIHVHNG